MISPDKEQFFSEPHFGRVLLFCVDREQFAIPLLDLKEVLNSVQATMIPDASEYIEGVFQLRGKIIPLIHIGPVLGVYSSAPMSDTRILVINKSGVECAFRVDGVLGIYALDEEQLTEWTERPSFFFQNRSLKLVSGNNLYIRAEELLGVRHVQVE